MERCAARRNVAFLRAARTPTDGHGFAVTVTLRDCPPSGEEWSRLVKRYLDRLMDELRATRIHWVVEWQRRQVPHLHAAVYLPDPSDARALVYFWCRGAEKYGPNFRGQDVHPIWDDIGWREYVSKHLARGVGHYQRQRASLPPHWQGRTGRVWGTRGAWELDPPVRVELQHGRYGDGGFYAWRRLVRAWRVAHHRARGQWRQVVQARRMLSARDRALSEVRGVSEWLRGHGDVGETMLLNIAERGFSVVLHVPGGSCPRQAEG